MLHDLICRLKSLLAHDGVTVQKRGDAKVCGQKCGCLYSGLLDLAWNDCFPE
jgi:hypothetical protein